MRQSACLVINPITVDNFAALFKCTPVVQWLGSRISDQGVPGSNPAGAHFVVALSKSHLPCLVLDEPRKRWTDDRLGQTVTRLEIMLCLMC